MRKTKNPSGLYQKNGEGPWYLPVTVNGKRVIKSTGTSDLKLAVKKVPEIQAATFAELTAAPSSPTGGNAPWTISKAFEEFLADKVRGNAPENTLKNYRSAKNVLVGTIPAGTKLSALTYEQIAGFVDHQLSKGRKASSIRYVLVLLVTVLRYAGERGYYQGDPRKLIPKGVMTKPPPRKRFLSPEEIRRLLDNAQGVHVDYIVGYLYTGCRKTELFRICPEHVNLTGDTIEIPGTKTEDAHATIPLHPDLKPVLLRRMEGLQKGTPIFPRLNDIQKCISRAAERAGLEHTTCHDLRRTTGSLLASANVSLQIISKVIRHKDIATTARTYAHLIPAASQEAIQKLPSLMGAVIASPGARKTVKTVLVVQIDRETGNEIARFPSIADASRQTGIARTRIAEACKGMARSAGGYLWAVAEKSA